MRRRYSIVVIMMFLIVLIAIMECFTEKEETVTQLPVSVVTSCEYVAENSEVHVNLFEINSKKKTAKMINSEIRDIFEKRANEYIASKEEYEGVYTLASEYSLHQNLLSIKIYETDSNIENTSGNIYAVVYDIKNDMQLNLSAIFDLYKLDYDEEIEKARQSIDEKHSSILVDFPYGYVNDKGNIELIARSLIQVDTYTFWNNIEIHEIDTAAAVAVAAMATSSNEIADLEEAVLTPVPNVIE